MEQKRKAKFLRFVGLSQAERERENKKRGRRGREREKTYKKTGS